MKVKEHHHRHSNMDQEKEPVVLIDNLTKSFGDNHVLRGFSCKLYAGENLAILGKSGSGKSVLIKCMVGLLPYDSGTAKVLGSEVAGLNQHDLDLLRGDIGFLFQGSALYDSMTVRENLEFPLRRSYLEKKEGKEMDLKIKDVLESVGLSGTEDLMPEELSGGMKKRIALARTLIINPKIILYDEPTSGLDPITSKGISRLMVEVQQKYQASSLIITHDVECARTVANRIIILSDGINYAEGTFDELNRSEDPTVSAFFH